MAFDYKQFIDGEPAFSLPYWKQVVDDVHNKAGSYDYNEDKLRRQKIQENEIALRHPNNDSFIRIKDDGTIEAFAHDGAGLRLTSKNTIQLFGDKIQLIGRETQVEGAPNASAINKKGLAGQYPVKHVYQTPEDTRALILEGEV